MYPPVLYFLIWLSGVLSLALVLVVYAHIVHSRRQAQEDEATRNRIANMDADVLARLAEEIVNAQDAADAKRREPAAR